MCLHLVFVFMSCTRGRGWSRPCLSHLLRLEDYGWPITSLLSLINEDNELPLLPVKPWCSSAGTEERGREGCVLGRVCESARGRQRRSKLKGGGLRYTEKSARAKEVTVFTKGCSTEMICRPPPTHPTPRGPSACTVVRPVEVRLCLSLCMCAIVCPPPALDPWGPLQRLGTATVTDAPDCQLASSVKTTS